MTDKPAGRPDLVPSKLTIADKEACIRLYFCADHYAGATGNVNSCPMCVRGYIKRRHGADVFEHTPVHIAPDYGLGPAVCGVKRPFTGATNPRRVTCPDCLIVDYFNQEGVTNPLDNWEPAPLPPKPEPAEPPHMGPQHEHDCDACIFLGSRSYAGQMHDLFFCPPNKFNERGNLIARRGPLGDYVSGMDFVDREPMLAVAAILALRGGHMSLTAVA